MKVIVQGQGVIDLTQKDFVASGGEGSVYARGVTAYKVFTNPSSMLPLGKITELAAITDPCVMKPETILLDPKSNTPIGYTTPFVKNALPLCQTFTRAFRERENLDHPQMLKLVVRLREMIESTHKAGVLVVDLNELNYLVEKTFHEIYGIDVGGYQTKHYPATALMPSVKDWSVKGNSFTEGSDWFSFACVAYQMFTGIHPYKGKHPTVHGLEERMRAGISVFDPSVTVPKVVYPLDVIPPGYRAWFKAVLQGGERIPPPVDPGAFLVAALVTRTVSGGALLEISEVQSFNEALLGFTEQGSTSVSWTANGVWLNLRPALGPTPVKTVGFSPKLNHALVAWIEGADLKLFDATTAKMLPLDLRAEELMGYAGRIYVRSTDQIIEVLTNELGNQVVPSPKIVTHVLEHATKMYRGVVLQDLLGSAFVSVYPRSGASYQLRIPELEKYKVIDARFDNRVLMVTGIGKGTGRTYDRLTFVFDGDYTSHNLVGTQKDITPSGLNFLVLEGGTCVHLTEEEKLEVWNVDHPGKIRVLEDKALGNDLQLIKLAGRVGFLRGNKVFSMRMK